ncbi:MAG: hypothetical protein GX621_03925 [Pirellulaceae bacterium]|nr:hypothetical protein [Pirellulaceae bacterium]
MTDEVERESLTADETTEEIYRVLPPDPETNPIRFYEPVIPKAETEADFDDPAHSDEPPFQFTIRDLLILTTVAAICLSIGVTLQLAWSVVAGVAGVAVLVALAILSIYEPKSPVVRLAWWFVLTIYLLTCLTAVVQTLRQ